MSPKWYTGLCSQLGSGHWVSGKALRLVTRFRHELRFLGRGQLEVDGASVWGRGVNQVAYFNLDKLSTWANVHL